MSFDDNNEFYVFGENGADAFGDAMRADFPFTMTADKPWLYSTLPAPITRPQPSAAETEPTDLDVSSNDLSYLQWHFDYLGDIEKIWDEYSGAGVNVGIYDDGLEATHPDLVDNYDASLEVSIGGVPTDPLGAALIGNPHGTAVAGLIAASNNDEGVVGVAWGASLTGVNIFSGPADVNEAYAGFLEAVTHTAEFDVVNHSWGKFPGFWQDEEVILDDQQLKDLWFEALETGRDGLGTIIVKAAGNANQNSNGDSTGNSRATIIVGAYDDDGDASYYSSFGANLLVSAPSSGANYFFTPEYDNQGLVTTDVTGFQPATNGDLPYGYNGLPDTDYTNGFGGTSGATPIVAGVVALMLEANPNLGWRDVQNILAYSSTEVGSGVGGTRTLDENHEWFYNGADNWNGGGLHYSEDYGYGGVNAYNAVRMAEVWHLFNGPQASPNESTYTLESWDLVEIADASITDYTFSFEGPAFEVEFVDVQLVLDHTRLDDLEIYLISPNGTQTTLIDFQLELQYTPDTTFGFFNFGANAFRGEDGIGDWTLRIVDTWTEDAGSSFLASLSLNGRDSANGQHDLNSEVYHYTDEAFIAFAQDDTRKTLLDDNGGTDWLDMSTMTGDLYVRLLGGMTSTMDGRAFVKIVGGSTIENAVGGDGDDRFIGNGLDNVIYGMRGDDSMNGAGGDDTLAGGAGNDTLIGNIGADNFVFDRALNAETNVDTIVDFSVAEGDKIWLEASIFDGLSLGTIDEEIFFTIGSGSMGAEDRILYDGSTGELYFDADGSGSESSILFATLMNQPVDLSFSDFVVVDTGSVEITTAEDRAPEGTVTYESTENPDADGTGVHVIYGSEYSDFIFGKSADDEIYGLGDYDYISGGDGNDFIDGGEGVDILLGDAGDDVIYGGGSPTGRGDEIYGGEGNDILHGSDQPDGLSGIAPETFGDGLRGNEGDDILYGHKGDDFLFGDEDNDTLYGGTGNDILHGGLGDDHLYGGLGQNELHGGEVDSELGFDTAYFDGNFDDYVITGMPVYDRDVLRLTRVNGLEEDEIEIHDLFTTVEQLVFADQTINLLEDPLILRAEQEWDVSDWSREDVDLTADGYEISALVNLAGNVTITDLGAENGTEDKLHFVSLDKVVGDAVINSDALGRIDLANFLSDFWSETYGFGPGSSGSVTINAAAGERTLDIKLLGVQLDAGETVTDSTATAIEFHGRNAYNYMAGAGVNDANLLFDSATSLKWVQGGTAALRLYIPNVTTIDLSETQNEYGTVIWQGSANGEILFFTPLDDADLATAGGSVDFEFIGGTGSEHVMFGNLGTMNAGNDGTSGDEAGLNAGLGLQGTITLGEGNDVARILGTDAFQGGTLDGGDGDGDVIQMTFGVAEAIADISGSISNFEVVQFDVTSQDHTVGTDKFDDVAGVIVQGYAGTAGENTIELVEGSSVTFKSDGEARNFGTVNLNGSASGVTLSFIDPFEWQGNGTDEYTIPADGQATGIVHVRDATSVEINTDSRDDYITVEGDFGDNVEVYAPAINSFGQILKLDAATTVTVNGDTGWDFTTAGTEIANVTLIDGSGITQTGEIGAIKANAANAAGVHFIGGAGADVFGSGVGDDVFDGGDGNLDIVTYTGASTDYTIVDNADGSVTVSSATEGSDTLWNVERLQFTDGTFGANANLNGAPSDIGFTDTLMEGELFVYEYAANGTKIGTLLAQDPDTADVSFTFTLIDDAGGRFQIVGDELQVKDGLLLDYEHNYGFENWQYPWDIVVEVEDAAGNAFQKTLQVNLGDIADEYVIGDENDNFFIGSNIVDGSDYFFGAGGNDTMIGNAGDDIFEGGAGDDEIDGWYGDNNTAIYSGNRADYTLEPATGEWWTITDNRDGSPDGTDTIRRIQFLEFADGRVSFADATASNEAPTDISLDSAEIAEFADNDTVVGTLTASDPDTGEAFTYELTDDAGGRFAIDGDTIVVADSAALDFESDASHDVTVKVTDSGGLTHEKTFTIDVTDVNETPVVSLENVTASLKDDVSTSQPIKVADIVIHDDAIGVNRLSVTGRDAALFEIIGMALFLQAGVVLDAAQAADLQVAVAVDDDDIAGTPDAVSTTVTLVVEDADALNQIEGTPGSEIINGTSGNDHIDGQGGSDAMHGGDGDDTYIVDDYGDTVHENPNEGIDTVVASGNHVLGENFENVTLTGNASFADGNELDNVIIGNDADNVLSGLGGDDYIDGGAGADQMFGGTGNDTYVVDSYDDVVVEHVNEGNDSVITHLNHVLEANVENITLTGETSSFADGNALDNVIIGNAGDNVLSGLDGDDYIDGGAGADQMFGGTGNDTYVVDNAGDVIGESADQGTDTVEASVNYALGNNLENLTLTGSAAIDGTGNALGNTITGNAAANVLSGGAGADTFVFNTALGSGNVDTLSDFEAGVDMIHLDQGIFAGLGAGALAASAFAFGTAGDGDDRIIYDQDSGALYFDIDGSGEGAQVQFAQLDAGLGMTHSDFFVV
jgi:Ca2+-binding RTX toxin-like protein